MTGKITHHEIPPHRCTPGWDTRDAPSQEHQVLVPVFCNPGDIWTCNCGLKWMAFFPRNKINPDPIDMKWMPYIEVIHKPKRKRWWRRG